MSLPSILALIQIVLSVLLGASVLLQHRGGGVGSLFGGGGEMYQTKRGAEKVLFWATIVLAALFLVVALLQAVVVA